MEDVRLTRENNLCIACGICKAVCPVGCISFEIDKGIKIPLVDSEKCVKCGKCYSVCPGKGIDYTEENKKEYVNEDDFWFGNYISILNIRTKNEEIRYEAVSGGFVTQMVECLLQSGSGYESAFLVGGHEYASKNVQTARFVKDDDLHETLKSRYLTVSHEKTIEYVIKHRDEKIIIVGTGCFVEGFLNVLNEYKLDRDNYFIIGLFCDKTMNYNIIDYFENNKKLNGKKMSRLYFRSKHESGWPGNVLIETSDGKCIILPKEERMKVKDYFVPERCLYCLDKLNMFADISVGDNYTGEFSDKKGCNSVIVRTKKGKAAIEKFEGYFEFTETSVDSIKKCQHLEKRKDNLRYEYLKSKKIDRQINKTDFNLTNVKLKHRISYIIKVFKLRVGAGYNNNHFLLSLCLVWKNLKLFIKKFL